MKKVAGLIIVAFFCGGGRVRADFKYTESTKITGGMMAGMMKVAGMFSQKAREPVVTTTYLKGNHLRTDQAEGRVRIIDLDARRFIDLDTQKHTYSIMTFDEVRAALQKLEAKGAQKGVKITPKVDVMPTNNTKIILGQPVREVKVRVVMQAETQDPKQQEQAQKMTFTVSSDVWIAPAVKGYNEIHAFHGRLAKELDWLPGAMFGSDPQMAKGMLELKKSAAALEGLPLLQYASIGMAGMPQAGPAGAQAGAASAPAEQTTASAPSGEQASSPATAVTKKLGGLFGGFGRKKKKQEQPEEPVEPSAAPGEAKPAGAPESASLADLTIEVTAFSSDAIDAALFEVPAGYREVPGDAEKFLGGQR